jgi:hypothetical protein
VDLVLSNEQQQVAELARQAFAEAPVGARDLRGVRNLLARTELDDVLASAEPQSRLLQVLIVEQAGAAVVDCNVSALFAGARVGWRSETAAPPVVAVLAGPATWARFPSDLDAAAVRTGGGVHVHRVRDVESQQQTWGDPFGQLVLGEQIVDERDDGTDLVAWYRCLSAAEAVGAAGAALDLTWRYVGQREQFGARLIDRQVVRHQLGELEMELNAARLLVYEGAWLAGQPYAGALAAAGVTALASALVPTLHRLTGAIGFTLEYPLARLTGRVRGVSRELGSSRRLFREVARERRALGAQEVPADAIGHPSQ